MTMTTTKTKKWVFSSKKRDDIIPILPLLRAFGFLVGGAEIANAVSTKTATQRQLKEMQRHNCARKNRGILHHTNVTKKWLREKKKKSVKHYDCPQV